MCTILFQENEFQIKSKTTQNKSNNWIKYLKNYKNVHKIIINYSSHEHLLFFFKFCFIFIFSFSLFRFWWVFFKQKPKLGRAFLLEDWTCREIYNLILKKKYILTEIQQIIANNQFITSQTELHKYISIHSYFNEFSNQKT